MGANDGMDDPRKHKRLAVTLTCNLRGDGDPTPIHATVLNVSPGGMGVIATKELPVGTLIEFQHNDFPCVPPSNATSKCRVISMRTARGSTNGFRIGLVFETPIQNLLQWAQMQTLLQKRGQPRSDLDQPRWGHS